MDSMPIRLCFPEFSFLVSLLECVQIDLKKKLFNRIVFNGVYMINIILLTSIECLYNDDNYSLKLTSEIIVF